MKEKYLFVDSETGELIWTDNEHPFGFTNDVQLNFTEYVRKDIVDKDINELTNKLAVANNDIDRLSMRIYTRS